MVYPSGFVIPPLPEPKAPPPRVSPVRTLVFGSIVIVVLATGAIVAPRAMKHYHARHRPPVVRVGTEAPHPFGGVGEMDLPPMSLGGGNYDVMYRSGPGTFYVRMRSMDEAFDEDVVSLDRGPANGSARVANVPPGQYQIHVAGEGTAAWAIEVIPR